MGDRKRVFIVVKTYPRISREYSELVCTAGIMEDGSWIRLYPVPFRKLDLEQKYPKFTWIELDAERNEKDFRLETYRPNLESISVEPKQKKPDWDYRRKIILGKTKVYTDMSELINDARSRYISLAIFKPTQVTGFKVEEDDRNWDPNKLAILKQRSLQQSFFQTPEELEREFRVVNKLPYKFLYVFKDSKGRQSTMMIEDWEIGMLYFNCLRSANGDEKTAVKKVREKYLDEFLQRDLFLFLGTTLKYHNSSKNPFTIVGVFAPPKKTEPEQYSFFDL